MELIRKENGNVELRDSGVLVWSMAQLPVEIKPIDKEERDHVKLFQNDGRVEYIYVDDLTETQIEPNAAVPFAGTVFDLADLLSADFFFEVINGGGADILDFYRNIPQRFYSPDSFSSVSVIANNLYTFKIKIENTVNITEFSIKINTPAISGNAVCGLYSLGSNGEPDQLIVQTSTPFDLSVSGQQNSIIPPIQINPGFYCLSYLSDTAATLSVFSGDYPNFGGGFGGFMYGRLLTSLTYNPTLPTNHPTGGTYSDNFIPDILLTTA
jgi:hypothetical protein